MPKYSFIGLTGGLFTYQQAHRPTTEADTPVEAYVALVVAWLCSGVGKEYGDSFRITTPFSWRIDAIESSDIFKHTKFTMYDWEEIKRELVSWLEPLQNGKNNG